MYLKILLFFLVFCFAYGQVSDDFSDGDFTNNPAWTGNTNLFIVNTQRQLQSNGSGTDTIFLATANSYLNASGLTEWRFWVKLDFSPSTSNFARFYLMSDQSNLLGALNGYFLQIGGISGTADAIDLYRQDGNTVTKILNGTPGYAGKTVNILRLKVTRDPAGAWKVYVDTLGNENFLLEGTVTDNTYSATNFLGVWCKHTSTRANKFFFDDIYAGPEIIDTIPPVLTNYTVIDSQTLRLFFSENLQNASMTNIANYSLSPTISITQITALSGSSVELSLASPLQDQTAYTLNYNNLLDLAGNPGSGQVSFTYYAPKIPAFREIRINEMIPDPVPAVGLPEREYIELFNNSNKIFPLNGFKITDKTDTATINGNFLLQPGEYIILCAVADTQEFSLLGKVIGLANFPALNNSGDSLEFLAFDNTIVDYAYYDLSWYHDTDKDNGGWSLELIDPDNICDNPANWKAAQNNIGGTPGSQNSVYKQTIDTIPPKVSQVKIISDSQLEILFDEVLDTSTVLNSFLISPVIPVLNVLVNPDLQTITLLLASPLDSNKVYTLKIFSLKDCPGNSLPDTLYHTFAIPLPAKPANILLSEILFDPLTGHKRYVELYNNSDKIINLKNWMIGRGIDSIEYYRLITSEDYLFFPKTYLCISEDTTDIKNVYNPPTYARFFQSEDNLPAFASNEDKVWVLMADSSVSDVFHYLDDYHFPDIRDKNGVALERICYNCETQNENHWTSASSVVNYGTPGYKNSQFTENLSLQPDGAVSLENDLITPDGDGQNDNLTILLRFPEPNTKVKIYIYDRAGRLVKEFQEPLLLGTEETRVYWDGTNNNNTVLSIGAYILVVEATNVAKGSTKYYKFPVIVGKK